MKLIENILKGKGLSLVSILIIIGLIAVYSDVLSGDKEFYTYDKISAMNVKESMNKSQEYPYWFPWMMGGVPSVHSAQNISDYYFPNYIMKAVHNIGIPWFWNYIFHLFFAGIGMYLLTLRLNLGRFVSIISSLGFVMMPYITAMLVHGHGSQVMTICYIPWIFYAYINIRNAPSMKALGIFTLLLALQLLRGHIQMAYYTWMMLGLYIIIDFIHHFFILKSKDSKGFLYTISGLILSTIGSLSLYLPMLSYTPFSTRSSDSIGGAGIEYATEYSFSFSEIITFFIPSYYGFGDYTYWGTMTMTNFPNYMGIILLLLSFYGILRYKSTVLKVFLLVCGLFFLILSFGKNFMGFYAFFYNNFPFFSKFRNPMYLLICVQFCTMVLSGMGLKMMCKDIVERKIFIPIYASICMIFLCLAPIISLNSILQNNSGSIEKADQDKMAVFYQKYYEEEFGRSLSESEKVLLKEKVFEIAASESYRDENQSKIDLVGSMVKNDINAMSMIVLVFGALALLSYYLYPKIKNKGILFFMSFGLLYILVFFDMYFVDRKITHPEKVRSFFLSETREKYKDFYEQNNLWGSRSLIKNKPKDLIDPDVLNNVMSYKKEGGVFRVVDPIASRTNEWSKYHVEDILGYHPAKLKLYQNIILSQYVLDMLNVKYEIKDNSIIDRPFAKDRAFFVRKVSIIENIDERREFYLKSINPSNEILITDLNWEGKEREYVLTPEDKVVNIDNSNPNRIVVDVATSGPQFLVVSDIFYPNGWYATINGKRTSIFEINDLVRGIEINSKGNHIVEIWFYPSDLKWGSIFSYLSFILIIMLIFYEKIRCYFVKGEITEG